ncbi:hypothetical protein ACFWMR_02025 [Amycolatopsis thailandensis]|uniref:hypothetical protein n=1 Tax=Amycolatopsis thailandensis TaxID=589330 RepID=UPI0036543CBC
MPDTTPEFPTSRTTIVYVDTEHDRVTQLDRVQPEHLAEHGRRSLRIAEALLEEALDNVRDALHMRFEVTDQPFPLAQDRS